MHLFTKKIFIAVLFFASLRAMANETISARAKGMCEAFGQACGLLTCSASDPVVVELITKLKTEMDKGFAEIDASYKTLAEALKTDSEALQKVTSQIDLLTKNTQLFDLLKKFNAAKDFAALAKDVEDLQAKIKKSKMELGGELKDVQPEFEKAQKASAKLGAELHMAIELRKQPLYIRIASQAKGEYLPEDQARLSEVLANHVAKNGHNFNLSYDHNQKQVVTKFLNYEPTASGARLVELPYRDSSEFPAEITGAKVLGTNSVFEFEKIRGATNLEKLNLVLDILNKMAK